MAGRDVHSPLEAVAIAAAAGACALVWPPGALLVLAVLAARAIVAGLGRVSIIDIVAPCVAAAAVAACVSPAAGIGALFVWRLIADSRWSIAEEARLSSIAGVAAASRVSLVLTPAFGLAMVAYSAPHMLAGLRLDLPHLPLWAPMVLGGFALAGLFDWALRCGADVRLGVFALRPATHQAAHHLLFLAAYGAAHDVTAGLAAMIAWRLAHAQPRLRLSRSASVAATP